MAKIKILGREDILNAQDLKTEVVKCPEWGGNVIVRGLTASERDKWENSLYVTKRHGNSYEVIPQKENIRAKFIAVSVIGEDGKLLFTTADIEALSKKSAAPIDRIFEVAQKLSGMSNNDIEELEKNLKSNSEDISITN